MTDWNNVHEKAKKVIDEGYEILKSGMEDAAFLAENTVNATRLHFHAGKSRLDIHKLLYNLGDKVYQKARDFSVGKELIITEDVMAIVDKIKDLESSIKKNEEALSNISIVKKDSSKGDNANPPTPGGTEEGYHYYEDPTFFEDDQPKSKEGQKEDQIK